MRTRSSLYFSLMMLWFVPVIQSAETGSVPPKAEAFLRAYPNFFSGFKENTLLFREGGGIQFDDGRSKTFRRIAFHR